MAAALRRSPAPARRVFCARAEHRILLAIAAVAAEGGATLLESRKAAIARSLHAILRAPGIGDLGPARLGAHHQAKGRECQSRQKWSHRMSPARTILRRYTPAGAALFPWRRHAP